MNPWTALLEAALDQPHPTPALRYALAIITEASVPPDKPARHNGVRLTRERVSQADHFFRAQRLLDGETR